MKQFALIVLLAFLSSCGPTNSVELRNTNIVLWHSWSNEDAQTLTFVIDRFEDIFTDTRVIHAFIPANEILERYISAAAQGLGPDILIGPHDWTYELATEGLIRPVNAELIDASIYYASTLTVMMHNNALYGIPLSMQPQALYYNTAQVASPAQTLTGLLEDAEAGQGVAINMRFASSLWGVQAFGGEIFDDAGRVVLDQGGLTNWLNWLSTNSNAPGLFFGRDETILRDLFINQQVAYYVGRADELNTIRSELETVDVARLPDGPNGVAGPLLQVETLFFNAASSAEQAQAAISLAQFLTNIEQSTTFMRELGLVPVNRRVSVNANVYPAVSGFLSQVGNSIALPDMPQVDLLLREGDEAIIRVLEGIQDPVDAATRLTQTVNDALGFEVAIDDTPLCQQRGTIRLWDSFSGRTQDVLETIMQDYMRNCPGVAIERTYIAQDLAGTYIEAVENDIAPDLVILSSDALTELLTVDAIMAIPQDRLESYLSQAQMDLQRDNRTYGVPISLDFNVLYFNTQLVNVPTTSMDELLNRSMDGVALGIPRGFDQTLWGMTAFGAITLSNDIDVQVNTTAMGNWFSWLQTANTDPLIVIRQSDLLLGRQFEEGRLGYVISSSGNLAAFEAALETEDGTSRLGITQFPSGDGGVGLSALNTDAFFITQSSNEETRTVALDFALFATNTENQMALMEQTRRIPANVNITVPEDDILFDTLLSLISNTLVLPDSETQSTFFREGQIVYSRLLANQITPAEAAQLLSDVLPFAEASEPNR